MNCTASASNRPLAHIYSASDTNVSFRSPDSFLDRLMLFVLDKPCINKGLNSLKKENKTKYQGIIDMKAGLLNFIHLRSINIQYWYGNQLRQWVKLLGLILVRENILAIIYKATIVGLALY